MLCSKCNKNVAVIFITKMEQGRSIQQGLCIPCAREMGINPIEQMVGAIGIDENDMENISSQVEDIMENENGEGAGNFFENLFNMAEGKIKGTKTETKNPPKKKSVLDAYGTNLTKKARNGEIDCVVGRNEEIKRVIQILNRRTKNNPALLGEPGVGKTAIAEGLADRIAKKQVPAKLLNKEVYLLDFTALVAGTQFRGQFEARLKAIIEEAKERKNIVFVIDEMHNIVGAGDAEGAMSAANILKPALARGEIQVVGATTLSDYRKFIEKDSALERRFQPVMVDEPSIDDAVEILKGIKGYYEKYHKVKITDEVIKSAVIMSERYIPDRFLPDKAIDLIDEAGSKANLKNVALAELARLRAEFESIEKEKEEAVSEDSIEDYQKAADLKTRECAIREEIANIESQLKDVYLTVEDIASVVENWTKIPVRKITEEETKRLLELPNRLKEKVVGQDSAVDTLSRSIIRSRAYLSKKRRPASFIFVGPTGVGKTYLAKMLATELFASEDALIRVDMSEYMEKHTVAKLIGSPPGYVGYDEQGQLTEKVRRKPYSVLLFDEIEKAHTDVHNILLQILDDGRLTDSHGRVVSFENTIIIMTSNAGSDWKNSMLGFGENENVAGGEKVKSALKNIFRPEFLNRVSEVIAFNRLNHENMKSILDIMIGELNEMLEEKGMHLDVEDDVKDFIIKDGYDKSMGARPMRKSLERNIEDKLSYMIIKNERKANLTAKLKDGQIIIE